MSRPSTNEPRGDGAAFPLGPALLFCPGNRPDRFAKAAQRADAVILDLEDAVAPAGKAEARTAIHDHLREGADRERTVVRVNSSGSTEISADLAALAGTGVRWIMLAKAESAEDVDVVVRELPDARVIALCESARGIRRAEQIASHPSVVALMWGAEDLLADLGGTSSRTATGEYRQVAKHSRAEVLLSARSAGAAAIDSIYADIEDLDGVHTEALDAAASGFVAKACIHPGHVAQIRSGFAPAAEEVEYAQALLDELARRTGPSLPEATPDDGAFTFRGAMVDAPLIRHARRVLSRAQEARQ